MFAGQVEWDAIVQVCRGVDDDRPEFQALADLVDRSLVTVHVGNPTTYGMLDARHDARLIIDTLYPAM